MPYIAAAAVIAIMLLQFSGAIPQSSVGGPMTIALAFLAAAAAVGVHDAWTMKRGVVGWIVSIVVALVGAFLAANLSDVIIPPILMLANVRGSLAATGGPIAYVALAVMMLVTLAGAWIALWIVNRWR